MMQKATFDVGACSLLGLKNQGQVTKDVSNILGGVILYCLCAGAAGIYPSHALDGQIVPRSLLIVALYVPGLVSLYMGIGIGLRRGERR